RQIPGVLDLERMDDVGAYLPDRSRQLPCADVPSGLERSGETQREIPAAAGNRPALEDAYRRCELVHERGDRNEVRKFGGEQTDVPSSALELRNPACRVRAVRHRDEEDAKPTPSGPFRRGRQRFGKTRGRSRSRLGGHYRLRPVVRVDRPERAEGLVERFV